MSDTLTDSVARLYRAGSEHSQNTLKLRIAADTLVRWLAENLPGGFELPCGCKIWPSGEFQRNAGTAIDMNFTIVYGQEHGRTQLFGFSKLIADGFLDQLSKKLETETVTFKTAVGQVDSFLDNR